MTEEHVSLEDQDIVDIRGVGTLPKSDIEEALIKGTPVGMRILRNTHRLTEGLLRLHILQ